MAPKIYTLEKSKSSTPYSVAEGDEEKVTEPFLLSGKAPPRTQEELVQQHLLHGLTWHIVGVATVNQQVSISGIW